MKKLIYLSSCDTCRRIMKETGTEGFELYDLKDNPIDEETVDNLHEKTGSFETLFNKRAQKFRTEGLNQQPLSEAQYRNLILKKYTFLKRPIYIIDDEVFLGNSKKNVAHIKTKLSE
ncbi:MAG: ArsC/Spx/MgsR family protein [Salibacteraceae bacterium]